MCMGATSVGLTVANDDPYSYEQRVPAAITGDDRREPAFAIDRADQIVEVNDLGLQFDDQQRPGRCVPCQDVDQAAFAAD